VSGTQPRAAGRAGKGPAPAPLVAVLERRGRFLTVAPVFPPRESAPERARGGGPGRLVVRAGGSRAVRASAGDLVLVKVAQRGSNAEVIRVIGRPDVARDLIEAMMLDRGLDRGFDAALEREARAAGERVMSSAAERRDLRELATFTIDPASARDFDDAISAEPLGADRTRVWVHIADVAAHVPEGSLIDREARRRATSVYVPGAVEPMLPHALSSDACSLRPGVERPAVTVELELDGHSVTRAAFYRSLIRSDERLDYERVDRIFAGSEQAAEPWGAPLGAARRAAVLLQEHRERSGALVVDSEEPEFTFDQHGNITEVLARAQTESHRLIEHLMIAANEAVAGMLEQRGIPCLFRVHERPEPERIERLANQLASLEVPTPALPQPMSYTQAAELVGEISQRVDDHVRATGHGRMALSSLVLRSLKQAYYSPRNLGHAGLQSASYCHFTSPIRRYPDLVCHRALLSAVGGGESAPRAGELVELGTWTSERERDAMKIERAGDDMARCFVLEQLLYETGHDQSFAGEITGLISAGAFVAFGAEPDVRAGGEGALERARRPRKESPRAGSAPPFEGMLPVRLLGSPAPGPGSGRAGRSGRGGSHQQQGREGAREWWELNEEGTILHGERTGATLRLGDAIDVRVARVDTARGRVDLVPGG
jgi:ribonuclease R